MPDKALEKAKCLTRQHDVITMFPIAALFLTTIYIYIARDVSADQSSQREEWGVHPSRMYSWLISLAGAYAIFDIIYIVVGEPSFFALNCKVLVFKFRLRSSFFQSHPSLNGTGK